MQPNNLTALDFEDVKASIKSYLRTRSEFTDYDFDGSALSYMVDALAYNTYYSAFNANMALNEAFLPSSTVRDNVVNIAKLMNYTPRSRISSRASVKIDIQTDQANGVYPSSVTIKKGPIATGGNFVWNILRDTTAEVSPTTGIATFPEICIYEGQIVNFQYIVNTFARQTYSIPSAEADLATLQVSVKANETATASDIYNRVDTVTGLTATTRAYFLNEGEDMRFEVRFGDDSVGRALKDGEVVQLEYLVTSGKDANEVSAFNYIGTAIDSLTNNVPPSGVTLTVLHRSQMGTDAESIESIKYNAPRFYASQYRAVTAQDYGAIVRNIYPATSDIIIFGGEDQEPPEYGKVFIVLKPNDAAYLTTLTKKDITDKLKQYMVASVTPVILDPSILYVEISSKIFYNGQSTDQTPAQIRDKVIGSVQSYLDTSDTEKFNGKFRYSKVVGVIDDTDRAINSNLTSVMMRKDFYPQLNSTFYYEVCFQNTFDEDCDDPVLSSTGFRVTEYPNFDVYVEDRAGKIVLYRLDSVTGEKVVLDSDIGDIDYATGELKMYALTIIKGTYFDNRISLRVRPLSNDIKALREVYLDVDVANSSFTAYKE